MRFWVAVLVGAVALPVMAQGTLAGRSVTLNVLTYDDPANPVMDSRGRTVTVGAAVEFGMGPEFRKPGFDVVPVQVQIGPDRIAFSYGSDRGTFMAAAFNGYVLRFQTECALFAAWQVDLAATTMAVTDQDIHAPGGALFINVAGRDFGPDAWLVVDLRIADCPMS